MTKKWTLTIKVDYDDGDYAQKSTSITDEQLELVKTVAAQFKGSSAYWGTLDCRSGYNDPRRLYPNLTEEQIEIFEDFTPYCPHGFHAIEGITVVPDSEMVTLFGRV